MKLDCIEQERYEEILREVDKLHELRLVVDWISFTFNPNTGFSVSNVIDLLGFEDEEFCTFSKGAQGYRNVIKLEDANIRILSDGQPQMGIHVDVSGGAISTLLAAWKKKYFPNGTGKESRNELNYILVLDVLDKLSAVASFTRIDLAIDDIGCNYYSIEDIVTLIEHDQIISKFRNYSIREKIKLSDKSKLGSTVYLGSRSSNIMLRIYDKELELAAKDKGNSNRRRPWIRYELELKKEYANRAVVALLETHSLSEVCLGILNNYVRFIVPDASNKSNCSTEPTWEALINDVKKVSLYVVNEPLTLEQTRAWIDKAVGPSLSAVIEADGGSLDFILDSMKKWQGKRMQNKKLTKRLKQEKKNHK